MSSRWEPSASAELSTNRRSVEHICEQRLATWTRHGSDSSLKPVTSDYPPKAPRSFLNCNALSRRLDRHLLIWPPLASLSQWPLCSRVNRCDSALRSIHRQLIFAALTSYASDPVRTAARAAVVVLKTSGNWKTYESRR